MWTPDSKHYKHSHNRYFNVCYVTIAVQRGRALSRAEESPNGDAAISCQCWLELPQTLFVSLIGPKYRLNVCFAWKQCQSCDWLALSVSLWLRHTYDSVSHVCYGVGPRLTPVPPMRHWGQHCSLTMAAAMTLTAPKTPPPLTTTSTRSKSTSNWPKVAAILLNASGQLGYHYMPASINRKLTALLNTKTNNKNSNNSYDSNRSVETIISEMIFGSVALNFCARNASKIHRLSDDLYMNSFIVQIDVTNGQLIDSY